MNKNILITGGTRGLGLSYAFHLASKGYNVGLTDISEDACKVYGEANSIDYILNKISNYGVKGWFFPADLTDIDSTKEMISNFTQEFDFISGVITNAGGDISGKDKDASGGKAENNNFFIDISEHKNIFERNYDTCLNTLREVVPIMIKKKTGKIITISSINAIMGTENETSYSMAKAAIIQLTRSLAKQLRMHNINVNCIVPGPVKTGRFMATLKGRNIHDLQSIKNNSKLDRAADPIDIAKVVEFLFSTNSDFVSGDIIKIDGGLFPQPL